MSFFYLFKKMKRLIKILICLLFLENNDPNFLLINDKKN